jgi:hypothetical protein
MNVAVNDMPAVGPFRVSAAGEGGHALLKRDLDRSAFTQWGGPPKTPPSKNPAEARVVSYAYARASSY